MPLADNLLIGQLLLDEKIITPEQLESGLREQKKSGLFICAALVRLGFASEEKIYSVLSRQLNIPYIHLREKEVSPEVIQKVPAKFACHYKVIPLEFKENTLTIAMSDPLDIRMLDDIRLLLGIEVKGSLACEADITDAIRRYYGVGAETLERMIGSGGPETSSVQQDKVEDLESLAEDASVITFVNQIISEAIRDRATDIHLEPFHNELRVRFRIDGVLYNINIPETIKYFQPAIVSRIKIMAQLNITERRLPQDGRIKIRMNDLELDLRVSVIPTIFGEAVQIRLLSSGFFLQLDKLGMNPTDMAMVGSAIEKTHGIIFVSGPTGSGKSTTLYACLSKINSDRIKIITIEDPVEYQLRGVNQIQVVPQIGYSFASALRHMLRHDPDVMMIGEVRDYETAEIAIRSALTGHLVFSTLHTNDAAGVVTRLLDMGVEPYLVSSSLECLVAQRLVRIICPHCRQEVSREQRAKLKPLMKDLECDFETAVFYEGKGCEACRFTGYIGRTGIYEVLPVTQSVRDMIIERRSSQQIKQLAVSQGMKTLRQDGLRKIASGITTLEEVMRVTQEIYSE